MAFSISDEILDGLIGEAKTQGDLSFSNWSSDGILKPNTAKPDMMQSVFYNFQQTIRW